MNFIEVLAVGSVFDPTLTPCERCENAITAFCLLDLGRMLSRETEKEQGGRKSSCWLAAQTHNQLQELCGLSVIAACGLPGDQAYHPWRSSELPLEQFFGSLRNQFGSSQMRCRDYLHASAKRMYQSMRKNHDGCTQHDPEAPLQKAVSDGEFVAIAKSALQSAIHLTACCCKPLRLIFASVLRLNNKTLSLALGVSVPLPTASAMDFISSHWMKFWMQRVKAGWNSSILPRVGFCAAYSYCWWSCFLGPWNLFFAIFQKTCEALRVSLQLRYTKEKLEEKYAAVCAKEIAWWNSCQCCSTNSIKTSKTWLSTKSIHFVAMIPSWRTGFMFSGLDHIWTGTSDCFLVSEKK